jgi:glycerophosphoryl diester phosphodiesterase
MDTLKEFVEKKGVFIAAHRGASGVAPENTIAAYEEALKGGAEMIEVDTQMTIDKKIICYHDFKLGRTAKGNKYIGRLPWKYLRKLDVGTWFDKYFHSQRIPTLTQTIDLLRDKAYLYVEVKSGKKEPNKLKVQRVYETVKNAGYIPYTLFGSFDYKLIGSMKELDDSIHTAAIKHPMNDIMPSEIKENYGIEAFVCASHEATEEIDKNCKENGIYLGLYSIDNWYEMEKIKQFNVKTIVSNYPGTINPILHRYFSLSA